MDQLFVGRHGELEVLTAALVCSRAQLPRLVFVEGAGGSGKTALMEAFADGLDGELIARASGDEAEVDMSYAFLDQLQLQLVATRTEQAAVEALSGRSPTGPRDACLEGARLLGLLALAQERRPLVLVLDDVHLADGASLSALTFALRRLRSERVLTVLATRPEGAVRRPAGLDRLAEVRGTWLHLGGLSVREITDLAQAVGFGRLTERGASRLREHTDGNPLYVRALLNEISLQQLVRADGPLPAPHSLALLVLSTLSKLSPTAQHLAAAAAVLGQQALLEEVAELADVAVADSLAAAQALQVGRIFAVTEQLRGRAVAFVHPLVRAAVYDDLGEAARAALHRGAAAMCTGPAALHHRLSAAHGPDPDLARSLVAHAEQARAAGNWGQAARALLGAVRVADSQPTRDRLLIDAVELLLINGDLATAQTYASQLEELPTDRQRLHVQARIAWLRGHHGQAEALAHQAWEAPDDLDASARDRVAAMIAQMCIMRNAGAEAAQWAERALASGVLPAGLAGATRGTGAVGLALSGRNAAGMALLKGVPQDASMARADQRQELAARGMLRLWADDLEGARADLALCLPSALDGFEPHRLVALCYLAETEYRRGDWDAGATLAEQAVTLVQDTEQVWLLAFAHAVAVFVPAAQGRWEQAEAHLAACRQAARTLGDQPSRAYADNAAVHLSLCRGDAAGVVAAARDLLGDPPGGSHDSGIFSWATHHATALVELGCLDEAAVALDSLTSAARQGQHGPRLARLARVRGQLAAARRQPDQARAAFNEALRLGEGTVDALEAAMSHAAYGRFLRRRGERRAAVEQLTHAESLLTTLQAEPFLRRCRAELTACGHPVGPHAPVTHHVGVETLTPQELAVANLVCAGQTNREAAQELVLSVKTIGYHLGHVYAKLGVRSRTELVARLGGTPGPHGT